ncbi:MAG: hypothetical protein KatS3mg110_0432 [Pirellulaceae bacterium]|nr:MAG: hypothetical protein KatS3mg110_0432 [Pirellulaceae bacterium]
MVTAADEEGKVDKQHPHHRSPHTLSPVRRKGKTLHALLQGEYAAEIIFADSPLCTSGCKPVGSFFEQYRLYFLAATFALLGVARYLTGRPSDGPGHAGGVSPVRCRRSKPVALRK